ncbi:hypothetical protein PC129_g6293 [Phytophthora cactorum]|uniref:Uncharacterized protein n=1 Tax=Phytophthora cactorum TaxID=29920 RepID=A0A329SPF9_9STRA|nr:hypothetical protein Pcac1_g3392 [Phytophthora cactorum]KAG2828219.1 hypothetical protein PC111_g8248 [Phytophthora cactorum]KAG2829063.1 hypothetical protein PC112_g8227 [Phytophthora cactorum]KAG2859916.1 hypothetical protein PC113_g8502 [Phytophthora cactorum]KAG2912404.1 hypothetical protein PC114_g8937 [Phytophthora cactorum]
MDFNDLYLFVGPPMTRGPPQVPLLPSLLPPPPPPASSIPLLPPMLPRPPTLYSKKTHKQNVRLKPYHRLKPSQRCTDNQVRPQVKTIESCEGNEREMQMMMSELELEYRTAKKDWSSSTMPDIRSFNAYGDPQATWSTVLEMCPQFFALDPIVGEYF